ncbi:RES family NAD+ phosphorylase [Mucilaginibacter sp. HMF5004]|uniref:RES domain-containing protein n=1 Tax=Mucilaginibacter rivuli TaxID=2857527 RepID=UPI001C5D6A6C|nr:RES domain-containing protein [Mucilaginibacter rivuli]MBW4890192.1 RES family NAD+ phosphorylase [Mucilaginibacter rivuli]
MRITEFLKDPLFSLPTIQPPRQDFKQFTFRQLDNFIDKLEAALQQDSHFEDLGHYPLHRILERQRHLSEKLKETLNAYYNGKPAEAFKHLNDGLVSNLKDFNDVLNIKDFLTGENFYRIRCYKENFPIAIEDFFHIPFEKRGLVKTQRFSIPGFPSLYLGSSIYLCWEELNRPNINEFQAVRVRNTSDLRILDLSPPNMYVRSDGLYDYLMIWPLVMCCSVKVRNQDDTFKPEYIIPQLLLQWVREMSGIDGIAYQTTHMDFRTTLSRGDFINIVLPVKDNKSRGLCDSLKEKFEMTNSTSIQLSQCSTGAGTYLYNTDEILSLNRRATLIEIIQGHASHYGDSVLGELERTLNHMPLLRIGFQAENEQHDNN